MEEETVYQLDTNQITVGPRDNLGIFWRFEAFNQLNRPQAHNNDFMGKLGWKFYSVTFDFREVTLPTAQLCLLSISRRKFQY